jgi:dipeptidyl aminopeptidase/acylaminoacyl peptidase
VDELFPHASPDGKKVVFIVDRGEGKKRVRDVYYMNIDGTNHVKVGQNGRQPFWSPDGTLIGYMRGTHVNYREGGSANKELYFYNIQTGKQVRHPKNDIEGLLNPCWSPNGRWILASVMGGMGLGHSIVIIETKGNKVIELRKSTPLCRYSEVAIGDLSCGLVTRWQVYILRPRQKGGEMQPARYVVGNKAEGWDIWIVKPSEPQVKVQITHDGLSNKEPDWVYVK